MLKLVVCIIILAAVRCAQENLTCLRNGDLLNLLILDQKGEPGILDEHQIKLLRNQFNFLSQEVEALKNQGRKNRHTKRINLLSQEVEALKNQSRENQQNELIHSLSQEVEALKNQSSENRRLVAYLFNKEALHVPPHVYVYQLTPDHESWQESQQFCQNWGGTLAVFGVRTMENRKKLFHILPYSKLGYWIGANDIASEGNWIWVNGDRARSSELIWARGEPNKNYGDNQDCVEMYGAAYSSSSYAGRAAAVSCMSRQRGLCEKRF